MIMNQSIALLPLVILTNCVLLSVDAASVYKWVDTNGVTHYSDEAPASSTTQVTLIDIPTTQSVADNVESDYYSIANQWARLHEELIKREKLKLEKARQKAAQSPQIVYINESNASRYVVAYPGFLHRRHYYKKPGHHPAYLPKKHLQGKPPATLPGTGVRQSSYHN
jgi:hypothetical protein